MASLAFLRTTFFFNRQNSGSENWYLAFCTVDVLVKSEYVFSPQRVFFLVPSVCKVRTISAVRLIV